MASAEGEDCKHGFVLTNYSCRELGKMILLLVEERESLVGLACELRKERDSLNGKVTELAGVLLQASQDKVELTVERDSLRTELKAAVCARDHNRECIARLVAERDSLREKIGNQNVGLVSLQNESAMWREKSERALGLRDRVIEEIQEVKKERDSLKSQLVAAICGRDHNGECVERLVKERDYLKRKVDSFTPIIVEFASELRDKAQGLIDKANQASGGGVA